MFRIFVFIGFLAFSGCQSPNVSSQDSHLENLDSKIDSLMKVYHTAGVAVAVVSDEEVLYSKGFGFRDMERQLPVTDETIFGIGSCSKAFTATLLGILSDQGEINFEDPPKNYLTDLKFFNEAMNKEITIRHMLSHGTGLPNMSTESSSVLFVSDNGNDIIPRLEFLSPQSGVGEDFIYNNLIYALAGRLSESLTKKTWEENLKDYIFNPLQMQDSYGSVDATRAQSNYSKGYGVRRLDTIIVEVIPEHIPTRDAGGNIHSSVADMSKWMQVWLNEGRFGDKSLFSKDYFKSAIGYQQLMFTDSASGDDTFYGFGWMISVLQGHLKVEHSGGISGFSSNVVLLPEDNLGIVVLSNQNIAGIAYAITNELLERVLEIEIAPNPNEPYFSTVVEIEDPKSPTVVDESDPPSHPFEDFQGDYFHPGYGTIEVRLEGETLYAKFPFTKFRLEHTRGNHFEEYFTEEVSQVVSYFMDFEFAEDANGRIDTLRINFENPYASFIRVE
ncbi:MAG: serine hydrolase [Bacteroidota bacterium]